MSSASQSAQWEGWCLRFEVTLGKTENSALPGLLTLLAPLPHGGDSLLPAQDPAPGKEPAEGGGFCTPAFHGEDGEAGRGAGAGQLGRLPTLPIHTSNTRPGCQGKFTESLRTSFVTAPHGAINHAFTYPVTFQRKAWRSQWRVLSHPLDEDFI